MDKIETNQQENNEGLIEVVSDGVDLSRRIKELEKLNDSKVERGSFEGFKIDKLRSSVLEQAEVIPDMMHTREIVQESFSKNSGNWKEVVNNEEVVNAVTADKDIQEAVLGGKVDMTNMSPGDVVRAWRDNYYKSINSANEKSISDEDIPIDYATAPMADVLRDRRNKELLAIKNSNEQKSKEKTEVVAESKTGEISSLNAELIMADAVPVDLVLDGNKETKIDFNLDETPVDFNVGDSQVKAPLDLVLDGNKETKIDFNLDETPVDFNVGDSQVKTPVDFDTTSDGKTPVDINTGDKIIPTQEDIDKLNYGNDPDFLRPINGNVEPIKEIISSLAESAPPKKRRPTPEEYAVQLEEWKKGMEKSQEALDNRKKESVARLEKMGVKENLLKGLDWYDKLPFKQKIAVSAFFAGAAVLTGAPVFLATSALAVASASRAKFTKMEKSDEENGKDLNNEQKRLRVLKSVLFGSVLVLATGTVVRELSNTEYVKDLAHSAGEKFSGMMSGIKSLFGFSSDTVNVAPVVAGVVAPEVVSENIITPEVVKLPEYTIQSSDNLTNIIKNEVISKIPGAENLTNFQKENMIQNLLAIAKENPSNSIFATINQFANPDLIQPGQTLDLNAISDGLSKVQVEKFGMGTLLDHAQQVTQYDIASSTSSLSDISSQASVSVEPTATQLGNTLTTSTDSIVTSNIQNGPYTPPIETVDKIVENASVNASVIPSSIDETIISTGSGGTLVDGSGNPVNSTNFDNVAQQPVNNLSNITPGASVSPELSDDVRRLAALAKNAPVPDTNIHPELKSILDDVDKMRAGVSYQDIAPAMEPIDLSHYKIQQGDTLNSIMDKVFTVVNGGAELSADRKTEIINGMINDAKSPLGNRFVDIVGKLSDPGFIQDGKVIDLGKLKDSVEYRMKP